jgi:hypothetical protein
MPQLALTSPANIGVNAGTLARQDAARTFVIGPNVSMSNFEIRAVGATTKQIFALGWQVLLQLEFGTHANHPSAGMALFTLDGDVIFFPPQGPPEIRRKGTREQQAYPHDPALAAEFFARHRSSQ